MLVSVSVWPAIVDSKSRCQLEKMSENAGVSESGCQKKEMATQAEVRKSKCQGKQMTAKTHRKWK